MNLHGALTSKAAYPSQRSSRKGCCHPDIPAISCGPSDPPFLNMVSSPRLLSRGSTCSCGSTPAPAGPTSCPSVPGGLEPGPNLFGLLQVVIGGFPKEQASGHASNSHGHVHVRGHPEDPALHRGRAGALRDHYAGCGVVQRLDLLFQSVIEVWIHAGRAAYVAG